MRNRIESAWNARVFDHGGATEVGPWGFADAAGRGLHINESQFLAEFVSVETGHPAQEGELAHLVLTTLGRTGARSFAIAPATSFVPFGTRAAPTDSYFSTAESSAVPTTC